MEPSEIVETRAFWNAVAADWRKQVGEEGDENRQLNSDPVLWSFAGEVAGLRVLDAGCGTGYLTKKLHDRGARVVGVDFSENMIALAREHYPGLDFHVDSCAGLKVFEAEQFDLLISNYVLMDVPDLREALGAFQRVLRPGGVAVLIFSHPCFPQGFAKSSGETGGAVSYQWKSSYFEQWKSVDPPWGHFQSDFIWYHRPLSDYWKAFQEAGLTVLEFEEPRISGDRLSRAASEEQRVKYQSRPCSVAFKLQKMPWSS